MHRYQQDEIIVKASSLSKRFRDIMAVDDLSFGVKKGDIYGFLGPNGSGKSTSIRLMLSLLRPDAGNIEIFGMPLRHKRMPILRRVGSFIEKPDFYEYLSANRNLELLCRYSGIPARQARIMEVLGLVGLSERAASKVKTYSKGMKQRLGIAQALLHDPELLILDEPASGLDPSGNRDIRELIRHLNVNMGKTIILSSHNLAEIEMVASRMLIINKGKKVVEGDVRELLNAQEYLTVFVVDDAARAMAFLNESRLGATGARISGNRLELQCTRDTVPDITAFLAAKGVRIETVRIEQNLEEFFLNIT